MQSSPIGKIKKIGSVEIPDLTSIPETRDEPVFDGYHKGGVTRNRRGGVTGENCQKTIFDFAAVAEINSKMSIWTSSSVCPSLQERQINRNH